MIPHIVRHIVRGRPFPDSVDPKTGDMTYHGVGGDTMITIGDSFAHESPRATARRLRAEWEAA